MTRSRVAGLGAFLFLAVACAGAAPAPKEPAGRRSVEQTAAWLFAQGRGRAEAGDSVRAEQYFAAALRRGHSADVVLPLLLRVCLDGQRLRSALNYAEPHVRRHPELLELRQLVATLHLALGQAPEARLELESLLRRAPRFSAAHYLLAVIHADVEADKETARGYYAAYLALSPGGRNRAEARSWLADHPAETALDVEPSESAPEDPP